MEAPRLAVAEMRAEYSLLETWGFIGQASNSRGNLWGNSQEKNHIRYLLSTSYIDTSVDGSATKQDPLKPAISAGFQIAQSVDDWQSQRCSAPRRNAKGQKPALLSPGRAVLLSSESESSRELHLPGIPGADDAAKAAGCGLAAPGALHNRAWVIEDVEGFDAHFEANSLIDGKVLVESDIKRYFFRITYRAGL